jgi:hypothetical protein
VTYTIDIQIMGPKTQEVSERTSALQITSPRSTLGPASLPPASALRVSSARRCPGAAASRKRRERDKNKDFVTRLRVNRDREFRSNRNRARRNSKYCRETNTTSRDNHLGLLACLCLVHKSCRRRRSLRKGRSLTQGRETLTLGPLTFCLPTDQNADFCSSSPTSTNSSSICISAVCASDSRTCLRQPSAHSGYAEKPSIISTFQIPLHHDPQRGERR